MDPKVPVQKRVDPKKGSSHNLLYEMCILRVPGGPVDLFRTLECVIKTDVDRDGVGSTKIGMRGFELLFSTDDK